MVWEGVLLRECGICFVLWLVGNRGAVGCDGARGVFLGVRQGAGQATRDRGLLTARRTVVSDEANGSVEMEMAVQDALTRVTRQSKRREEGG